VSEAKRQRSAANAADVATLTRAIIKLNRRVKRLEADRETSRKPRKRHAQKITLYKNYAPDAMTPSGTPRYLPPFQTHHPLPAELQGIVKDVPIPIRSITSNKKGWQSEKVANHFRAAGYTVIRGGRSYVNTNGHTAYYLYILPLEE